MTTFEKLVWADDQRGIGSRAKYLLWVLADYSDDAGQLTMLESDLADTIDCDTRKLRKALKRLVLAGLVKTRRDGKQIMFQLLVPQPTSARG